MSQSIQFARKIVAEHISVGDIIEVDGDEWIATADAVIQPLTLGHTAVVLIEAYLFPVVQRFPYTLTLGWHERIPAVTQV